MAGTNFPGALDNGTSLPDPTANTDTVIGDHAGLHDAINAAVKAIEAKLGISASTPTTGKILTGGATAGTSTWATPAAAGVWGSITGTLSAQTDLAAALAAKLALAGGTMTGPLVLAADPTAALQPATKQYVDSRALTTNGFVFNETPSGTVNGTNTVFTAAAAYIGQSLEIYINGLQQNRTSDYVETTPGSGIFTFTVAPLTGDAVRIGYQTTTGVSGNADTVDGKHAAELSQVGDLIMSLRSTAGTNRLFMDGSTYNKSDWPLLWALNSSHPAYFASSTALTFTLANMTGRVPVGKDAGATLITTNNQVGQSGGAASHWHWQTFGNDGGGVYMGVAGNVPALNANGQSTVTTVDRTTFGSGSRATAAARFDGTGESSTLQPYIIVNYEVIAA